MAKRKRRIKKKIKTKKRIKKRLRKRKKKSSKKKVSKTKPSKETKDIDGNGIIQVNDKYGEAGAQLIGSGKTWTKY